MATSIQLCSTPQFIELFTARCICTAGGLTYENLIERVVLMMGKGQWANGEAPLQKRIQWVLESLGLDTINVCASNLIFLQSRQASDISFSLAKKCWPVHEAILNIIKPKLIIAFGNSEVSPYGYLHTMLGGDVEYFPSGHGNWSLKGFACEINSRSVYVAGLPHLSRYSPIGKKEVVEWLSKKI